MGRRGIIATMAALLMMCGCSSDDAYNVYSRYRASFAYSSVMTAAPLKNALTGPGEFCTISLGVNTLVFQSLTASHTEDITADMMYYQKIICISGFIVGMANIPEMNTDWLGIVSFDLACSNCYHDNSIKPNLQLKEGGFAYCSRCKRKYSLNNQGIVVEGKSGRPLERYHVSYDGSNRMVITN
ncbi:MAG: hypothetical protein J6W50_01605 [Bacteroidaceae bacterium]|nr:hypothetical protein [Bacteroidaceae bacterium]MBP5731391.1 hypothetical protein [Bacteroidaceae bacterium]